MLPLLCSVLVSWDYHHANEKHSCASHKLNSNKQTNISLTQLFLHIECVLLAQCLKQRLKFSEFIRPSLVLHGYYVMLGKVICFGTDACFLFSGSFFFFLYKL